MSASSITIRTGSRLHFGPLSYHPVAGRHFGGIGLMIDRPGVELIATSPVPQTRFGIDCPRAQDLLRNIQSRHPKLSLPVQIDVVREIPPHSGLGSGTQLSLAIMEAILQLHGREANSVELARKAERGDRSAVGIHGYELGGFLVDAGHAGSQKVGELACRVEFPPEWRVLLLHPRDAHGIHGSVELTAFQNLGALPEAASGKLCRLVLTEILPALATRNFTPFAVALYEYGLAIGEFFSATQGGVFASSMLRRLRETFPEIEITGMAQSSWGPTVALFAPSESAAAELRKRLSQVLPASSCPIEITRPRNTGRQLISEIV